MQSISSWIKKQWLMVVDNPRYALALGVLFVFSPLTDLLSQIIVNLLTLRRGQQTGFKILLPISIVAILIGWFSLPILISVLNTGLTFLPGFFAASLLRSKGNWRAPANGLIFLALLFSVLTQIFYPGIIVSQYAYLKKFLATMPSHYLFDKITIDEALAANLLFGLQIAGIVISTLFPLIIARRVQSDLFYPEGFKQEMLFFRADKWMFCFSLAMLIATFQQNWIAINVLPVLGVYFLISGLSLVFYIASIKYASQLKWVNFLVLLSLFIVPWLFAPICVGLGVIDCFINLRGYLSVKTGKAT